STAQRNQNTKVDRILSIIKLNDLVLSIKPYDWQCLDGRDAKRRHVTNIKSALLHGLFISPNQAKEDGVVMLMAEDNERTIVSMKRQIPQCFKLRNLIIQIDGTSNNSDTVR